MDEFDLWLRGKILSINEFLCGTKNIDVVYLSTHDYLFNVNVTEILKFENHIGINFS